MSCQDPIVPKDKTYIYIYIYIYICQHYIIVHDDVLLATIFIGPLYRYVGKVDNLPPLIKLIIFIRTKVNNYHATLIPLNTPQLRFKRVLIATKKYIDILIEWHRKSKPKNDANIHTKF